MELRLFGRTGLTVPVIGMGTWNTYDVRGRQADQRQAITDAALENGVTFFDSSPMYGQAEQLLGRTVGARRNRALIATKIWTNHDGEAERQIERSLRYFGGHVDVYQVHNLLAWEKRVARLERLQSAGAAGIIGLTHYSPVAFPELRRAMDDPRIGAIQIPYSAEEREVEAEILPAAASRGLGVIIMRPLGQGRLIRRTVNDDALAPLRPFGVTSWSQALLKWILSDTRCHVVIPATSNVAHLRLNAAAGRPPWFGPEERAYVAQLASTSRRSSYA
jgi:aryl-alcohol dehydrogenase-like predicted oxidoreductase